MNAAEEVWPIRMIVSNGEPYVCRADLLEALQTMAARMPNDEDRALAENLVDWIGQSTGIDDA